MIAIQVALGIIIAFVILKHWEATIRWSKKTLLVAIFLIIVLAIIGLIVAAYNYAAEKISFDNIRLILPVIVWGFVISLAPAIAQTDVYKNLKLRTERSINIPILNLVCFALLIGAITALIVTILYVAFDLNSISVTCFFIGIFIIISLIFYKKNQRVLNIKNNDEF
jgi:MFS family permease